MCNKKNTPIHQPTIDNLIKILGPRVDEFIYKFEKVLEENVTLIETAYKNKNYADILSYAHKVKSSVGQIGAQDLFNYLENVENYCKQQQYESLNEVIEQVVSEKTLILENLKKFTQLAK